MSPLDMWGGLPGRIIQVLKDFLPDELTTITTRFGDGIDLPVPREDAYYEYLVPVIKDFPSIRIDQAEYDPIESRPIAFGQIFVADYRHDIYIDAGLERADTPTHLLKMTQRYVMGVVGILLLFKQRLETTADPTAFVESVKTAGQGTVGPETEQQGHIVRTAIVPITIRRREARA